MKIKSHLKSHNGCITCKSRHVKCDETKPSCSRCTASGNVCAGYVDTSNTRKPFSKQLKIVPYRAMCAIPKPIEQGLDLVGFFEQTTSPLLSSGFKANISNNIRELLLDSDLQTVAVALAKHHSYFMKSEISSSFPVDSRGTLESYSRALQATQNLISDNLRSMSTSAAVCLLMVGIESLRGRKEELKVHLRAGLHIIRTANENEIQKSIWNQLSSTYRHLTISTIIHTMDAELLTDLEALPLNKQLFDACNSSSSTFITAMEECMTQTVSFTVDVTLRKFKNAPEKFLQQETLLNNVQRLESLLDSVLLCDIPQMLRNIMRARLIMCRIFLKCCVTRYQTTYDKHFEKFREIVQLLSDALDSDPTTSSTSFSMDLGILSLLRMTITQCRHHQIRRDARALLSRCPQREGPWDALEIAESTKILIEFEEGNADNWDAYGNCTFIAEEDRVHFSHVEQGTLEKPERYLVLSTRPDGEVSEYETTRIALGRVPPNDTLVIPF